MVSKEGFLYVGVASIGAIIIGMVVVSSAAGLYPTKYTGVVSYKSNVYSGGIGIGAFSYITIVIDDHSVRCDMFAMNEQQTAHVLGLVIGQPATITVSSGICDAQEG